MHQNLELLAGRAGATGGSGGRKAGRAGAVRRRGEVREGGWGFGMRETGLGWEKRVWDEFEVR